MDPVIRRSESIGALATALATAQAEMGAPQRTSENPHFGSTYADLAEVIRAVRPALTKAGLAVMQAPTLIDAATAAVETLMVHGASGEWVSVTSMAPLSPRYAKAKEGEPSGKMLPPDAQSVGSATTYLRRYALAALAGVGQDDDDANAATKRGKRAGRGDGEEKTFSLDDAAPGKGNKGKTWREVVASDPSFVRWALEKMDSLTTEAKLALRDALAPPPEADGLTLGAAVMAKAGPPAGLPLQKGTVTHLTRGDVKRLEYLRDDALKAGTLRDFEAAQVNEAIESKNVGSVKDWITSIEASLGGLAKQKLG